uniref:Uncharacterized protein n=1 Tax=Candidatus Kentrum sp. TC TaxID=2126339 RepID=A0A451A757_9GAMM|nr:MAG: hypothetical protein BECKTC1821D_GA0114238_10652 [Candidatus Kentron sp. TC]VFK61861.1 MAG: hypothetical protein BECKTC1821F_GA0114240_10642 [Candidatus Kentron sp. TC]
MPLRVAFPGPFITAHYQAVLAAHPFGSSDAFQDREELGRVRFAIWLIGSLAVQDQARSASDLHGFRQNAIKPE